MTKPIPSLEEMRREIDQIDDAIHDLLMRRTELSAHIGTLRQKGGLTLRPAREAEILRRLIARHQGAFPKVALIRIWREILGALVGVQNPFALAVYMPRRGAGYIDLARAQYGSYTPLSALRSPGQVLSAVAEGGSALGIVPVPAPEDSDQWWTGLMAESENAPRIITRLPFTGPRVEHGDGLEALVVARLPQDATGYDRSWIIVETLPDISRARLKSTLHMAGLESTYFAGTQMGEDVWLHLIEITGYVANDDHRLQKLVDKSDPVRHAVCVGGYAVPLEPEELAG